MDIGPELDGCRDAAGRPLDAAARQLLARLVAAPTPGGWAAAAGLVVGGRPGATLRAACLEVEPRAEHGGVPHAAVIAAALRRAAGTEQAHAERARQPGWWPSLHAYYGDDPIRRASPKLDFGVNWTAGGPGDGWRRWRVSWIAYTGEVIAQAQAPGSPERVVLVGVGDKAAVTATLAGWADPNHADLAWVFARFGWQHLPEAVSAYQATARRHQPSAAGPG